MMRVVLFLVLASLLATPVDLQAQSGPQWIQIAGLVIGAAFTQ